MRTPRAILAPSEHLDAFDALTTALDDPRSHPTETALLQLGHVLMTELLDTVLDTALEDFAGPVCEAVIGGLHSATQRIEREADRARDRLARDLKNFDGSEVADDDLQAARRLVDAADVAQRAVEYIRDAASSAYAVATGDAWSPWRGSIRASSVTAAQVDARAALQSAKLRRAQSQDPGDTIVAFRASPRGDGPEDAGRIFDALNWALAKWPDMSLALTGAPGGERIAKRWASQKRVRLVLARPDFDAHGRSAPFRANDTLMALEPVCVLVLSRSIGRDDLDPKPFGPALNLLDQAQRAGVRCVRIVAKGAAPPA
ncbi:DUF2493 domain-containing protein [Phenylobacterium sp.]|uniref:DUF2493 domain-containing protein n=1 Tax=Phenylobacterium sp. TaxID=1871053 RepID=UPI003BADB1DC